MKNIRDFKNIRLSKKQMGNISGGKTFRCHITYSNESDTWINMDFDSRRTFWTGTTVCRGEHMLSAARSRHGGMIPYPTRILTCRHIRDPDGQRPCYEVKTSDKRRILPSACLQNSPPCHLSSAAYRQPFCACLCRYSLSAVRTSCPEDSRCTETAKRPLLHRL